MASKNPLIRLRHIRTEIQSITHMRGIEAVDFGGKKFE
jgi:hypothetical protein